LFAAKLSVWQGDSGFERTGFKNQMVNDVENQSGSRAWPPGFGF
jgi:hypothetical protein